MRRAKGFTLIEFILYFGLIGLVMTGVIGFAVDYARSYQKAVIVSRVEQETRFGLLRVLRAVRQATALNVGASTFNNDNGVLSITTAAPATSPTVFDLSGGAVRIQEGAGAATPLTSPEVSVQKLRFSRDNLGNNNVAVTVEMTVGYNTPSADTYSTYTVSSSGTAVIRRN